VLRWVEFRDISGSTRARAKVPDESAATVACFRCGRTSHRVEDCFATSHADGSALVDSDSDSPSTPSSSRLLLPNARAPIAQTPPAASLSKKRWSPHVGCSRCGRTSHRVEDCFATSHADGSLIARLDSSQFHDDGAPSRSHVGINLPANANKLKFIAANLSRSSGSDNGACARCGRSSHKSSECFAATHAREPLLNHSSRFDEHAGGKRRRA
jgi:ribosomal protein L37E